MDSARMQKRFMDRKGTRYEWGDGDYKTLSYEKLLEHIDLNHPRISEKSEDGSVSYKKMPLGVPVGGLC